MCSLNKDRFEDAKRQIHQLLHTNSLSDSMFLIVLNKQGYSEKGATCLAEACVIRLAG